jgi:alkanesulfonate monooxygenase SsuD/methylene tetrahydromethanopterin reductase-like flavin-dependent oxidoreductase (luciferase family)
MIRQRFKAIHDKSQLTQQSSASITWIARPLGERYFSNGDLLWPSPIAVAAYLAARTERIRIGLAARILPFHHPLHVAADAATLDVLSRGRFDLGLSRGSMDEESHHAFSVSREEARERFSEAFEVLRLACLGRPFSFKGHYYDLNDIHPSPISLQRPHPPFYMVANNPQSLDAAADSGLPIFLNGAMDLETTTATLHRYRERTVNAGFNPQRTDIMLNRFVFVAETTQEAQRLMREPFMAFIRKRAPDLKAYLVKRFGEIGVDFDFLAREIAIFGGPEHCIERLVELHEHCQIDHFLCTFNLITLDHDVCVRSMDLCAHEVRPHIMCSQVTHCHATSPAREVNLP